MSTTTTTSSVEEVAVAGQQEQQQARQELEQLLRDVLDEGGPQQLQALRDAIAATNKGMSHIDRRVRGVQRSEAALLARIEDVVHTAVAGNTRLANDIKTIMVQMMAEREADQVEQEQQRKVAQADVLVDAGATVTCVLGGVALGASIGLYGGMILLAGIVRHAHFT